MPQKESQKISSVIEKDELISKGFSRRTTASEPKLSELVAMYKEIGHDVKLVEFTSNDNTCNICFKPSGGCTTSAQKEEQIIYCDIFTRPNSSSSD